MVFEWLAATMNRYQSFTVDKPELGPGFLGCQGGILLQHSGHYAIGHPNSCTTRAYKTNVC